MRVPRVGITEPCVIDQGKRGAWHDPTVEERSTCGRERGRDVVGEVCGVPAAAPRVQNEGRKVKARRAGRRHQVPSVGTGGRSVAVCASCVLNDVPHVSRESRGVSAGTQRLMAPVPGVKVRGPRHDGTRSRAMPVSGKWNIGSGTSYRSPVASLPGVEKDRCESGT